jgi:acyl-CoA dehydrogenase
MHNATLSEQLFGQAGASSASAEAYLVDRRELSFFLWEQCRLEESFLGHEPFASTDRQRVEALLDKAQAFAAKLAAAYRPSDLEGAHRADDGSVVVPKAFFGLWDEFRRDWGWVRRLGEQSSTQGTAGEGIPPLVVQAITEMFMGANPAFMTYGGFTAFAMRLIEQHGTDAQRATFLDKLANDTWDACYCATETQAGSDLTAIATQAEPLGGDVYALTGHKRYITAGMHPLTENTVGVVIARVKDPVQRAFSLSCFLVPWRWPEADGSLSANHVECDHVEDKMGFSGCANTHLVFGRSGTTRGYLLGNRPDVALPQLITLMRSARISTAQFGVAMASSAYLHSVRHATTRIQGRRFTENADAGAVKVPIVEHFDVQRMLLDMRSKVEGCRGMIGKLVAHLTHVERLIAASSAHGNDSSVRCATLAELDRHRKMVLLYTPVIKAYVSDEAWRIATTAIQVHGGVGYLRNGPVEQYARDIKVLSIWEGTNYMQAQDLLRDKLNYGRQSTLLRYFEEDIDAFMTQRGRWPALSAEFDVLQSAIDALRLALDRVRELSAAGEFMVISQFCTRFLEIFAEVVLGWVQLEIATVAADRLAALPEGDAQRPFYSGKLKSARFYLHDTLGAVAFKADTLRRSSQTFIGVTADEFGPVPRRETAVARGAKAPASMA